MSEKSKHRSKWQWFFIGLAAVAFLIVVLTGRAIIEETFDLLKGIDLRFLIILPLLQFVSYMFIAGYYRSSLKTFNHHVSYLRAYGTVVSLYFVEQVLPSGGVSGMSYIAYALRTVASVGMTTVIQISRYLFNYAAYLIVVPIAIVLLLREDPINKTAIWLGVGLTVGLIVVGFFIRYLVDSQNHIDKFVNLTSKFVNRVAKKFFKKDQLLKPDAIKKSLLDFHEGASILLRDKSKALKPFLFMLGSTCVQLSIVYLSFIAVGEQVNLGVIIMAFTVANIVGVISIVPGDIGVHEATMVFVLSSAGVDTAVALSATLLYRVYNKLIVLPVGFLIYTQYLKPPKAKNG